MDLAGLCHRHQPCEGGIFVLQVPLDPVAVMTGRLAVPMKGHASLTRGCPLPLQTQGEGGGPAVVRFRSFPSDPRHRSDRIAIAPRKVGRGLLAKSSAGRGTHIQPHRPIISRRGSASGDVSTNALRFIMSSVVLSVLIWCKQPDPNRKSPVTTFSRTCTTRLDTMPTQEACLAPDRFVMPVGWLIDIKDGTGRLCDKSPLPAPQSGNAPHARPH
jgi:hypothetical protein